MIQSDRMTGILDFVKFDRVLNLLKLCIGVFPVWIVHKHCMRSLFESFFFQLKIALHKNHCKWFSMQRKELLINFTKTSTSTELKQKQKNWSNWEKNRWNVFNNFKTKRTKASKNLCASEKSLLISLFIFFFTEFWVCCIEFTVVVLPKMKKKQNKNIKRMN